MDDYDGKSIYTNLSLSVVLLKLTGQRDSISQEGDGGKPVTSDTRPLQLFNAKSVFVWFMDDENLVICDILLPDCISNSSSASLFTFMAHRNSHI